MEHRPKTLAIPLSLLLGLLLPQLALADASRLGPEGAATLARGQALQQQAAELRQQADRILAEEEQACASRLLVNDCRNQAKARHLEQVQEARRLDAEGRELEYQARVEERDLKQQQRDADAASQAEELARRQKLRDAEQQEREALRQRRLAEKEAKAAEGERKAAERRARQEKKQADHARRVAEKEARGPRSSKTPAPTAPEADAAPLPVDPRQP